MSQGLRDIWGLTAPQPMGTATAEQVQEFRKAFAEKLAVINRSLKQAAPYGQSTQQSALDMQRQALYAAYQKVLSQMDTGNTADVDRVLSAADSLRDKSQTYVQNTESARQQWFEREGEIERVMERVAEMEDDDPKKAAQIREVIERIQAKANEGSYGESTHAADQFLPKFNPIYEDYLRQSGNTTVPTGEYGGEQPMGEYGSDVIDHIPLDPEMYGTGAPWKAEEIKKAASDAYDWAGDKVDEAKQWTTEKSEEIYKMAQGGDSRPLTEAEIAYARRIYGDKVDYSKIRVKRGSIGSVGSSRTLGNDICMDDDEFDGDTMELTPAGIETLVHEMMHVHQYQKDGWEYAPVSLWEQAKAYVTTGDRNNAYNWEKAEGEDPDPTKWNPEQQAAVVEDYNILLRRHEDGEPLTPDELAKLERMRGHVDKILNAPPEKDIIDETGEALSDAWDWTKDTAEEVAEGAEELWDETTEAASEAWDDAKEAASEAWDSATETAEEVWDGVSETAGEAWDGAKEAASDAWDAVTDTVENAYDTASTAVDTAGEIASEAYDTVSEAASDAVDYVTEQASETYESVSETASEAYDTVSDAASDAADYVSETASEVADSVSDTASQVADSVSETASEVADSVSDAASEAIDDVGDAASDAWNSVFG